MAWGIERPTFRLGVPLRKKNRHPNHSTTLLLYRASVSKIFCHINFHCTVVCLLHTALFEVRQAQHQLFNQQLHELPTLHSPTMDIGFTNILLTATLSATVMLSVLCRLNSSSMYAFDQLFNQQIHELSMLIFSIIYVVSQQNHKHELLGMDNTYTQHRGDV